jgi:nitrilase
VPRIVRVAAVQAAPIYLDLPRSIEKAVALIADAAAGGARLVAFPETWLPGYPAWLSLGRGVNQFGDPAVKLVYARLRNNSVAIPSPTIDVLAAAARQHAVVLSMGINERVDVGPGRGTLYNTQLIFDADGRLLRRHRKIMPTYSERLVWGVGSGNELAAVETAVGRVGALICWEHWMPLARQALHDSSEDFHVAAWPTARPGTGQIASRHYAFEGRCFVIAAAAILRARDLPEELATAMPLEDDALVMQGGSAIFGPDGSELAGPVWDEEIIVVADCDLDVIAQESLTLDVTGHYARPDIFDFKVRGDGS